MGTKRLFSSGFEIHLPVRSPSSSLSPAAPLHREDSTLASEQRFHGALLPFSPLPSVPQKGLKKEAETGIFKVFSISPGEKRQQPNKRRRREPSSSLSTWTCQRCSFVNAFDSISSACAVCDFEEPKVRAKIFALHEERERWEEAQENELARQLQQEKEDLQDLSDLDDMTEGREEGEDPSGQGEEANREETGEAKAEKGSEQLVFVAKRDWAFSRQDDSFSFTAGLPDQLIEAILLFVSIPDILVFRCLSKRLYVRAERGSLWESVLSSIAKSSATQYLDNKYVIRSYVLEKAEDGAGAGASSLSDDRRRTASTEERGYEARGRDEMGQGGDAAGRRARTRICPACGLIQARRDSEVCEMCAFELPRTSGLEESGERGSQAATGSLTSSSGSKTKLYSTLLSVKQVTCTTQERSEAGGGRLTADLSLPTSQGEKDWYFLAKVYYLDLKRKTEWESFGGGWEWLRRTLRQMADQAQGVAPDDLGASLFGVTTERSVLKAMNKLGNRNWTLLYDSLKTEFSLRAELSARSIIAHSPLTPLDFFSCSSKSQSERESDGVGREHRAPINSLPFLLAEIRSAWTNYFSWAEIVNSLGDPLNLRIEILWERTVGQRVHHTPSLGGLAKIAFRKSFFLSPRLNFQLRLLLFLAELYLSRRAERDSEVVLTRDMLREIGYLGGKNFTAEECHSEHVYSYIIKEEAASLRGTEHTPTEDDNIRRTVKEQLVKLYEIVREVCVPDDNASGDAQTLGVLRKSLLFSIRTLVLRHCIASEDRDDWLAEDSDVSKKITAPGSCLLEDEGPSLGRRQKRPYKEGNRSSSSRAPCLSSYF